MDIKKSTKAFIAWIWLLPKFGHDQVENHGYYGVVIDAMFLEQDSIIDQLIDSGLVYNREGEEEEDFVRVHLELTERGRLFAAKYYREIMINKFGGDFKNYSMRDWLEAVKSYLDEDDDKILMTHFIDIEKRE